MQAPSPPLRHSLASPAADSTPRTPVDASTTADRAAVQRTVAEKREVSKLPGRPSEMVHKEDHGFCRPPILDAYERRAAAASRGPFGTVTSPRSTRTGGKTVSIVLSRRPPGRTGLGRWRMQVMRTPPMPRTTRLHRQRHSHRPSNPPAPTDLPGALRVESDVVWVVAGLRERCRSQPSTGYLI